MEYLKEFGFTDLDIKDIINHNYEHIIGNISLNQDNVKEIISYLLQIGILKESIKEIFMFLVGLFFKTI